jgi:hypothetical protein
VQLERKHNKLEKEKLQPILLTTVTKNIQRPQCFGYAGRPLDSLRRSSFSCTAVAVSRASSTASATSPRMRSTYSFGRLCRQGAAKRVPRKKPIAVGMATTIHRARTEKVKIAEQTLCGDVTVVRRKGRKKAGREGQSAERAERGTDDGGRTGRRTSQRWWRERR